MYVILLSSFVEARASCFDGGLTLKILEVSLRFRISTSNDEKILLQNALLSPDCPDAKRVGHTMPFHRLV